MNFNFGQIYMVGFILFIGMLIGMAITAVAIKDIEVQDKKDKQAKEELITEQAHRIEVLRAEVIVLKDRDRLKEGEQE